MSMLERLLVVGLGSIGVRHLRVIRALVPGVQVIALRHRENAGANHAGVDHSVTSVSEALKFSPQAAVIANPASLHLDAAMLLAQAGLHLLVEKPLSISSNGVSELIETCRARGLTLMTAYNLRFSPSLQRFRELIREKRVGSVLSVRAEVGQFLPSWRPEVDYRQAVSAQASLGGGVLLELSHEIDYLRWLFGEIQWVSAIQRKQSGLEIDVEDTAHLVLGFSAEPRVTPVMAAINMDCIRHDTTRMCMVIGERGSLRWNAMTGSVEVFEQGGAGWEALFRHEGERDDTYMAEWRHFLSCVSEGALPVVSGHDGLSVIRVIEAARQSSKIGSVVQVQTAE